MSQHCVFIAPLRRWKFDGSRWKFEVLRCVRESWNVYRNLAHAQPVVSESGLLLTMAVPRVPDIYGAIAMLEVEAGMRVDAILWQLCYQIKELVRQIKWQASSKLLCQAPPLWEKAVPQTIEERRSTTIFELTCYAGTRLSDLLTTFEWQLQTMPLGGDMPPQNPGSSSDRVEESIEEPTEVQRTLVSSHARVTT